jgi:hypothetical protein
MLNEILVQLVFGFPAGLLSLAISALAIWKKWFALLIFAGVWAFPAMFYLIGLLQFGGAYAVYKSKPRIAWFLLIPLFLATLFMMYLTLFSLFNS